MNFCLSKFRGLLVATTAAMAVDFLMSMTDRVIAGHLLGERALAGLGLCQGADQLAMFVAFALSVGGSVRYLRAVGKFRRRAASRIFGCGLIASVLAGVTLSAALWLGADACLGLFEADAATLAHATAYWRWFAAAVAVMPTMIYVMSMVFADGDEDTCLVAYPVQLAVNAGASYALCRAYGTAGCAMGTLCGYAAALAVYSTHFLRKANSLRFRAYFSLREAGLILRGGASDSLVQLGWATVSFAICRLTSVRFGAEMLPVAATVVSLTGFTIVFDGVATAAQPLLEVYVAERNWSRVRLLAGACVRTVLAEAAALSLVTWVAPGALLAVFGIAPGTEIAAESTWAMRAVGLSMVAWAVAAFFNSYYQFLNRLGAACLLTAAKEMAFPLAFLWIGSQFGFRWMWAAYALAAPCALAAFAWWLGSRTPCGEFPLCVPRPGDIRIWDVTVGTESAAGVSRELARALAERGLGDARAKMAPLIAEETLMLIAERNAGRKVRAEVTLDLSRERPTLVIRDDGTIFDLTDADQAVSSFRTYLVAELMQSQRERANLTTTGFNRNRFVF